MQVVLGGVANSAMTLQRRGACRSASLTTRNLRHADVGGTIAIASSECCCRSIHQRSRELELNARVRELMFDGLERADRL